MERKKDLFLQEASSLRVLVFKKIDKNEDYDYLFDEDDIMKGIRFWESLSSQMGLFIGNVSLSSYYEQRSFYDFENAIVKEVRKWMEDPEFKKRLYEL